MAKEIITEEQISGLRKEIVEKANFLIEEFGVNWSSPQVSKFQKATPTVSYAGKTYWLSEANIYQENSPKVIFIEVEGHSPNLGSRVLYQISSEKIFDWDDQELLPDQFGMLLTFLTSLEKLLHKNLA